LNFVPLTTTYLGYNFSFADALKPTSIIISDTGTFIFTIDLKKMADRKKNFGEYYRMSSFVISFEDIDKTKLPLVRGKGVNLGELTRIEGIYVPDGFCISTEAFKRVILTGDSFGGESSSINELLDQLSIPKAEDRDKILELSDNIRRIIEGISIPQDIHEEISRHLARLDKPSGLSGTINAYALRSSATAEDLQHASFAGQHDTYLNIIGTESILNLSESAGHRCIPGGP
jgi:phosphoenolpyruvate synthase/pyruvate phosphate dikinase